MRVSSWTSLATVIKMASGFVTVKFLAVYAGTEGLAAFGQFTNMATILMTIASGAINTGVTKYIAENTDRRGQQAVIATAIKITLACSLITGAILIVTAETVGKYLFTTSAYNDILRIFGLTIGLYALNNLLISIINGFKAYKDYIVINVSSSVLTMALTIILVYYLGTYGALLSYVTAQSAVVIVTLVIMRNKWFDYNILRVPVDPSVAKMLIFYSAAALITAIMVPLSQIIARTLIVEMISIDAAGIWEGLSRISGTYLMVITASIQVYYLPRLSEIQGKSELIDEIKTTCKIVLPPLFAATLLIYSVRDLVITLLFTQTFMPMRDLFAAQLAGDFFKIASWLVAFAMPAKAMLKQFIATEIIFNISYILLAAWFISEWGFQAIPWAHCINYFVYLITVIIIIHKADFQ